MGREHDGCDGLEPAQELTNLVWRDAGRILEAHDLEGARAAFCACVTAVGGGVVRSGFAGEAEIALPHAVLAAVEERGGAAWIGDLPGLAQAALPPVLQHACATAGDTAVVVAPPTAGARLVAIIAVDLAARGAETTDRLRVLAFALAVRLSRLGVRPAAASQLTPRERTCLSWVRAGKTNWEIGRILGVSPRTVQFHISNAAQKLDADSRWRAANAAQALGALSHV